MMCVFNPVFKLPEQLLMVASIEAPFALLEEPIEAFLFDAIESSQMTLGLIPKVFNAVNVISLVGEELGVVDAHVMKVAHVKSVVCLECIGIDDTVGLDLLLDDRQQCRSAGVRNNSREDLSAPLEQAEDGDLAGGSPATLAFAPASEVALVGLDFSAELVAGKLAGYELAKPHEEARCSVAVHSNYFGRSSSGRAYNEQLDQLGLLARTQSTLPFIHYFYPKLVA
jgi:hypothetical protein